MNANIFLGAKHFGSQSLILTNNIKSGSIGIINITEIRRRQCRVPTAINGRNTALPSPTYHSGAAGNDINCLPKCFALALIEMHPAKRS